MPDTFTPYLNLCQPEVGGSIDTWGQKTNQDWTIVDTFAENAAGQIDAAFKAAQDAKADAASVKGTADAANAKATQAAADATQAKADAAAVKGIADDANAKATKAESDAAAVKGIADDAKATATRAETKADSATTTANQAKTDAATANTNATNALNKANSAAQLGNANTWTNTNTYSSTVTCNGILNSNQGTYFNANTYIKYISGEMQFFSGGNFTFAMQSDGSARVQNTLIAKSIFLGNNTNNISMQTASEMYFYVNSKATFVAQGDGSCRINYSLSVGGKGLQPGGGLWGDTSDIRTKKAETLVNFPLGLTDIRQLDVKEYQFNGKYGTQDNGKTYVGFVADDLLNTPFGKWCVSEFEWTDPETGKKELVKSVDATAIVFAMVNGHKELGDRTEVLQSEIEPLQVAVREMREAIASLQNELASTKAELAALKGGA